jgi:5-methylcytosine-specific restriction protein A
MPTRPNRFCSAPGCREIVAGAYCAAHQKDADKRRRESFDKRRGSASSRGYDARWQKVRLFKLAKDGLCEMCEKRGDISAATMVHHIKPISAGGDALAYENLMSLCESCHDEIHRRMVQNGS